jgi:hypothetical protein
MEIKWITEGMIYASPFRNIEGPNKILMANIHC